MKSFCKSDRSATHTHTQKKTEPFSSRGLFCLLFRYSVKSDSLQHHRLQHTRLPWPSPSLKVYSNSCPLSWWCHPTISFSVVPFSSYPQPFTASGSFPMSQFFASGGQSIGASALASVLPMSIQGWFPFGLTGLISLPSKGLSRVFSSSTIQKHQFCLFEPCSIIVTHSVRQKISSWGYWQKEEWITDLWEGSGDNCTDQSKTSS